MHVWHCTWKMKEYLQRKYKADLTVVNTVNNFSTATGILLSTYEQAGFCYKRALLTVQISSSAIIYFS